MQFSHSIVDDSDQFKNIIDFLLDEIKSEQINNNVKYIFSIIIIIIKLKIELHNNINNIFNTKEAFQSCIPLLLQCLTLPATVLPILSALVSSEVMLFLSCS
jgi:hypothetical protein